MAIWVLFLLLGAGPAKAATLDVCKSGCAYSTIGGAYTASASADTIEVKDNGTYTEDLDIRRSVSIVASSGFTPTWKGDGADEVVTIEGTITVTLEGFIFEAVDKRAIEVDKGATLYLTNSSMNSFTADEDGLFVKMKGKSTLYMTGCSATSLAGKAGAAVHSHDSTVLEIRDSTFSAITGTKNGGAIHVGNGPAIIDNCTFSSSTSASHGGAVMFHESTSAISNSTFSASSAAKSGGHVYTKGDSAVSALSISDCEFTNGTADDNGGSIYTLGPPVKIQRSTFTTNSATMGGAMYGADDSSFALNTVIFDSNRATDLGGALAWRPWNTAQTAVVENTIFTDNQAANTAGAAYFEDGGSVEFTDSAVFTNEADDAGGLYLDFIDDVTMQGNYICGNEALNGAGGGLFVTDSGSGGTNLWTNNAIVENKSLGDGGGAYIENSDINWTNNHFLSNGSYGDGGALYTKDSELEFINNLVAWSPRGDGLSSIWGGASVFTLDYNDWFGNLTTTLSGDLGSTDHGSNSLFDNPLLILYTNDGNCTNDNLMPSLISPLIDAGDPSITDADGSTSDIGAFGGSSLGGFVDNDGDGVISLLDCDDTDATIYPGATEYCDGVDHDCDGLVNEDDSADAITWYEDSDGDAFGALLSTTTACSVPTGYVSDNTDCDDTDADIWPGATEYCDGVDNDCDGITDEYDAADAQVWFEDSDGDTYGNASSVKTACYAPTGYVGDATDCNDAVTAINPGADEECDGIDNDCDGTIDGPDSIDAAIWYADLDLDGYGDDSEAETACTAPSGYIADNTDCDDTDPAISPVASEVCDGIDNDCDGDIDSADSSVDLSTATTYYADSDGDTYGDSGTSVTQCDPPTGYVTDDTDCDDTASAINPAASEVCDGVDNDCDGTIDVGATDETVWYADTDSDGYGDATLTLSACEAPTGYVADNTDCDDAATGVNPGAEEVCDGVDNDCNGTIDGSDATDATSWYLDDDTDGYGDAATESIACSAPTGYVADNTDCDDTDIAVNPTASEICDGIDNDCDGDIDSADSSVDLSTATTYYADTDGDSYGDSGDSLTQCDPPTGYVTDDTDCDDSDGDINPAATEICDGQDNDCDGSIDVGASDATTWYADTDGDTYGDSAVSTTDCEAPTGYVADNTDCDDSIAAVNPGAAEVCDSLDNDCDGTIDGPDSTDATPWHADTDGDGYGDSTDSIIECSAPTGYVADNTDCDDAATAVNPAASEICDGIDNDCDGDIDTDDSSVDLSTTRTYYQDSDGDGFGDPGVTVMSCDLPAGYVIDDSDCDDADGDINPSAEEICDGADNDCDGTIDVGATDAITWYADTDGDGYGDIASTVLECEAPTGYVSDDADCNDSDAAINPDGEEVCDGADNDCDGTIDVGATDAITWYADTDGDGEGDSTVTVKECSAPSGYVANDTDCDDTNRLVNVLATEICDGIDNDCDGDIDTDDSSVDLSTTRTYYEDTDGDGFGDISASLESCDMPEGYVTDDTDCDDTESSINPDADEYCDEVDNNCDGTIDEPSAVDAETYYLDTDEDGYGDPSESTTSCVELEGYVLSDEDCDDDDMAINPESDEYCDGVDTDCDGILDNDDAIDADTFYLDEDGDGYGLDGSDTRACDTPDGYTDLAGDCDDEDRWVYPGAPELCDSIDNDCNSLIDDEVDVIPWYPDEDGDTYGVDVDPVEDCKPPGPNYTERIGDCDDTEPGVNPDAEEIWYDGVDQNCDGNDLDQDFDGYDSADHGGDDCDDLDPEVHPDAEEIWYDGIDQNCDNNDLDQDGDGFDAAEYGGEDCDDLESSAYPGAETVPDNNIDEDCDGILEWGPSDDRNWETPNGNTNGTGCGCQTHQATGLFSGWVMLAALLGFARTRRRESA